MTSPPPVLILSRSDVQALMDRSDYLEAVEAGFRAAAEGKASSPLPMAIEGDGGTFHAKAAFFEHRRHYVALKLNGNFPGNPARGLPTIQGAILLSDGDTGSLLAIMDSIEVTLRRTAAATALAARYLARPQSQSILICGCGDQAMAQYEALKDLFPLVTGFAWDRDLPRAQAFATAATDQSCTFAAIAELAEDARSADIVVTCTTAHEPFLGIEHVRPGTFIAAVGADSPEKNEVKPELMAQATVVADVLAQCMVMGEIHHAFEADMVDRSCVHADIGQLVTGARPGRTNDDEITLFDSTGTALQDVAAAALIYERALQDENGLRILLTS
jgi:ornithine cyclodeaminase/alanine dehydrogenase-like protein (mu-crystallin family)